MNEVQTINFVNHGALAWLLHSVIKEFEPINKILLISPHRDDKRFVKKLFPGALIIVSEIYTWNLNDPAPKNLPRVDLAIALNVQMYARNPEIWIRNILSIANLYVFQDLKYRLRSSGEFGLGLEGDKIRYTLYTEHTKQPSFALSQLPFRIHKYFEFEGVKNRFHANHDPPIHICAAIAAHRHDRTGASLADVLFSFRQEFVIFILKNLDRVSRRVFRKP